MLYTLQLPGEPTWETMQLLDSEVKRTVVPRSGRTASGYGSKMPTDTMIRFEGRWYRVYVTCYGNAGSCFITYRGESLSVSRY